MGDSLERPAVSVSVMWVRKPPSAARSRLCATAMSSRWTRRRARSRSSSARLNSRRAPRRGSLASPNSLQDICGNTPSRWERRAAAQSLIPARRRRGRAMRISNLLASIALLGLAVGLSPAISFDGSRAPEGSKVPLPDTIPSPAAGNASLGGATPLVAVPSAPPVAPLTLPPRSAMPPTPLEAFRSGAQALRQGKTEQALTELEYAAEQGVPGAIWKLGRMYADGDGVKMNKARAYDYFRRLTTTHGDDSAGTPNARYLANAFVTLGLYHLDGIPGTLKADPNVAREMFRYAAAYFADPEAQYHLGRLYLLGKGAPK